MSEPPPISADALSCDFRASCRRSWCASADGQYHNRPSAGSISAQIPKLFAGPGSWDQPESHLGAKEKKRMLCQHCDQSLGLWWATKPKPHWASVAGGKKPSSGQS